MKNETLNKFFIIKVYWSKNNGPIDFMLKASSLSEAKQIILKSPEIKEIYSIKEINQEELQDYL